MFIQDKKLVLFPRNRCNYFWDDKGGIETDILFIFLVQGLKLEKHLFSYWSKLSFIVDS